jgi:hypothetical protein
MQKDFKINSKFQEYKAKIAVALREAMNKNPDADKIGADESFKAAVSKGKYKPLTRREALEKSLADDTGMAITIYLVLESGSTVDQYVDDIKNDRTPAFIKRLEEAAKNTMTTEEVRKSLGLDKKHKKSGRKPPRP